MPAKFWRAVPLRALVAVFFAAFLALGLLTSSDYGKPWDEVDEMDILRMNMLEYSRALGLDESAFDYWAQPNGVSLNALVPISECVERDHGVAALYPLAPVVLDAALPESARQLIWQMYCWGLFTLGAFALYACCRELGLSRAAGMFAALMLLLSPRFFAEGHYNSKDVVLMSLALLTLWQGLRLAREPRYSAALWFAFFGALAANTKLAGLAIWGLIGLYVLAVQARRRALRGRVLIVGAAAMLGFIGFYALLTPALWRAPVDFLRYLAVNSMAFSRWQNIVLFRGATFDTGASPLPWYYLPYMLVATTPLWALLLAAVGQLAALFHSGARALPRGSRAGREAGERRLALWLVTLLWALPLGFAIVTGTKVYNGWRHFYFIYGFLLILAAYGASWLWRRLGAMRPRWLKPAFAVMLSLCLLFTGVGIALDHPYQYVYYQPLERLAARGEGYQELDYWNVSAQDALRELCAMTDEPVSVGYVDIWSKNGLYRARYGLPEELRARIAIADDMAEARYLLVNPSYAAFSGFDAGGMVEVVSVKAYGHTIMSVYEREVSR